MRTRTIYQAMQNAHYEMKFEMSRHRNGAYNPGPREQRKARQWVTFEHELLRRMDHYDWYEARQRYFDESDALGQRPPWMRPSLETARLEMNATYERYQAHPREQAKAAKWRKDNGV